MGTTETVTSNATAKTTPYLGVGYAGNTCDKKNHAIHVFGAKAGVNTQYKNMHGAAEVTVGNGLNGSVKVGYNQPIGKDLSIDMSANANATLRFNQNTVYNDTKFNVTKEDGDYAYYTEGIISQETSYKPFNANAGLGAEVKLNKDWGSVGIGVEGGYRTYDKNYTLESHTISGTLADTPYKVTVPALTNKRKHEAYVTPTVSANVNFGKNFTLKADASMNNGNVGICYNF